MSEFVSLIPPDKMPRIVSDEALRPMPTNEEELAACLADPLWRVTSGCLYKIMVKGDGEDEGEAMVMPFRPNRAQRRFIKRLWHRNLILKARQLGFTTLIAIMWLDHALWNAHQRCGIIAQDKEAASVIFRDKVIFAYENLPPEIRERFPLARDSATELLWAHNNSSIRVATSMRSGTIHRLHISEFGKICARYPLKAAEVMTGSIPAVPTNGILVIESTAEGREGDFFDLSDRAEKKHLQKELLSVRDYRFHFYAWWQEPKYRLPVEAARISDAQHEYFDRIEVTMDCTLDPEQRAWYVATMEADFSGKEERMWQEYPSTPAEAFQVSTEGNWYAKDMTKLRKRGGITVVPLLDLPVYTFWDIGNSDGTAIWFMQSHRGEDRFIGYYEEHGEDLRHYAKYLQDQGYVYGGHYLPHDADYKKLSDFNKSTKDMLEALLPGQSFHIVPRITQLTAGIQMVRKHIKGAFFDQAGTKDGIARLDGYSKRFDRTAMRFTSEPNKANGCSEGADALRQWAQAKEAGMLTYNAAGDATPTDNHKSQPDDPPDWRL